MKKSKVKTKKQSWQEPTKVVVPMMFQSTKTIKAYLATLPEEERAKLQMGTTIDVATHAGATERLGLLIQTFYHIHSVQTLLQADIEIMLDNWGLWLKGFRPALTNLQQADDKFIRTMTELFNRGKSEGEKAANDEYYTRDVDSLFKKLMRWEAIPTTWKPGEAQKTNLIKNGAEAGKDETLVVEDKYEWCRIGAIDVPDQTNPEPVYCVGKMMDDETVQMSSTRFKTISSARGTATKWAKSEPGKVFIIYRRTNQWHYRPMEYKLNGVEAEK